MRKVKPLRSTNKEKADCVAAFKKYPSTHAWCCHHRKLFEQLDDPMDRVSFIMGHKPSEEKPSRLRSFRPVKALTKIQKQRNVLAGKIAAHHRRIKAVESMANRVISAYRVQIEKLNRERSRLWSVAHGKARKLTELKFKREWPNNTWDSYYQRVKNT